MGNKVKHIIGDETTIIGLLHEFIETMERMGYSGWYIGKTLAYIFDALQKEV